MPMRQPVAAEYWLEGNVFDVITLSPVTGETKYWATGLVFDGLADTTAVTSSIGHAAGLGNVEGVARALVRSVGYLAGESRVYGDVTNPNPDKTVRYWVDGLAFDVLKYNPATKAAEFWYDGRVFDQIPDQKLPNAGYGKIDGISNVLGASRALATAVGVLDGTSVVTAVAIAKVLSAGQADGLSVVTGVGVSVLSSNAAGLAEGTSNVLGVGSYYGQQGAGTSPGLSDVQGVGAALARAAGLCAGSSSLVGDGRAIVLAYGQMVGTSVVLAEGRRRLNTIPSEGSAVYTYEPVDYTHASFTPRRNPDITIQDQIDDAPSTASYVEHAEEPLLGSQVDVDLGDGSLFKGPIQVVTTMYDTLAVDGESVLKWGVRATDFLWFLNRKRPFGAYTNQSASAVVLDLMGKYAPTFDVSQVETDLPEISLLLDGTQDMASVLTTIAALIDGHWRLDVESLVVALQESTEAPDPIDDASTMLLRNPPLTITRDATQIRTRVLVRGLGSTLVVAAKAGATQLEVASTEFFSKSGGTALVGPDRITYSSIASVVSSTGGTGGSSHDNNDTVQLPGGLGRSTRAVFRTESMFVRERDAPVTGVPLSTLKGFFSFVTTFVYADSTESTFSELARGENVPGRPPIHLIGNMRQIYFTDIPIGPPNDTGSLCVARRLWYAKNGEAKEFYPWAFINNNTTTEGVYLQPPNMGQSGLRQNPVQPAPSGPTGPFISATEGNPLTTVDNDGHYSFPAGTYQFWVSAVYVDGTESGIGLGTPPVELSGTKSILMHMSSVMAQSLSNTPLAFYRVYGSLNDGEKVHMGNVGTGTLEEWWPGHATLQRPTAAATGGGSGSGGGSGGSGGGTPDLVVTSITRYFLTGVQGITGTRPVDTPVNIFEVCDDPTAQAELAVAEGGDGVHEFFISGDYASFSIARAAGFANLAIHSRPITTVRYATRDPKTIAGKTVVFNLSDPPLHETLKIQDVTIDQIHVADTLVPRYTATASTIRYTFDDMMRQLLEEQDL